MVLGLCVLGWVGYRGYARLRRDRRLYGELRDRSNRVIVLGGNLVVIKFGVSLECEVNR